MVDSSIDTLFLLIKGEIQALPVKARMKDMLLNSVGLINENFRNGDWASALDGIALILEKNTARAPEDIYGLLLRSLKQLRQHISYYMESEDISALNPQDFDFDPNHTEDENSLDTPDLNGPAFSLNESDTSTSLTEDDLQESGEGPNLSPYAINTDPVVSNHGVYSTSKVVEVLQESLQAEQLVLQQEWRHFPNPNDLDKQEETQSV